MRLARLMENGLARRPRPGIAGNLLLRSRSLTARSLERSLGNMVHRRSSRVTSQPMGEPEFYTQISKGSMVQYNFRATISVATSNRSVAFET